MEYTETETTGFRISKDDLKKAWLEKIAQQVDVSMTSTKLLIKHEILDEMDRVRVEVTARCDTITNTIKFGLEQKCKENAQKVDTTEQMKEQIKQMEDTMSKLNFLKCAMKSEPVLLDIAAHLGFELVDMPKNGYSPA